MNNLTEEGVNTLLFNCADIQETDKVLIISNPSTADVGGCIEHSARGRILKTEHLVIDEFAMHGQEPPADVAAKMLDASVIFGLTKMSMAHTQARLNANKKGIKYFSMPDYSMQVLSCAALKTDFRKIIAAADAIAGLLTEAESIVLKTKAGTHLKMNVKGRTGNAAPGCCYNGVLLASPPDAEANIAPVEEDTEGIAVIDGSIPCKEIGLLDAPVELTIRNGSVVKITGKRADTLTGLFDRTNNPKSRIVAEFGIGLNPLAQLSGFMLEDEGVLGTVHIGIGSNATIGGKNVVPFHLDHIMLNATIWLDDKLIMQDGELADFLKALL